MITTLKRFIINLKYVYIKENKRNRILSKVPVNIKHEIHNFEEIHEPLYINNLDCKRLKVQDSVESMDYKILYDAIYNDTYSYFSDKDEEFNDKLYNMFDIVCLNIHGETIISNISNAIIFTANTHGNINISKCSNCLIVAINVHGKININNCNNSSFFTYITHNSAPKYSGISKCKEIFLQNDGYEYEIVNIGIKQKFKKYL